MRMTPMSEVSREKLLQAVSLVGLGFWAFAAVQAGNGLAGVGNRFPCAIRSVTGLLCGQAVILIAFVYARPLRLPRASLTGGRSVLRRGILTGVAALVLSMVLTAAWSWLLEACGGVAAEQPMLLRVREVGAGELLLIGLVAGVFSPVVEEIYFRGWWLGLLCGALANKDAAGGGRRLTGSSGKIKGCDWWAIVGVAFAFALLHGSLTVFPGVWAAGICFGVAARRWGLASAAVAHVVFNLATLVAAKAGVY